MASRSVTRRAAAIRSGGNFIASLFEGGQLDIIGIFAAALRARYNIRQRRRRNQIRRAVRQLLNQLAREVQRAILQRLTDEYIQTAREIETFSEGLQAASEALNAEAAGAASEVLNDMSVTFEAQLRYMRRDADDLYRQIIEAEAENREATSATLNSAVQNAMRRFAENGVTGFTDAAGRNWGLYEYTNMAMRTAIQRAGLKATLKTMARIGHDLCFVQRHAGACPICEAWYGKILSASGLSAEYPSVQEAMDAGLFHPNCCDVLQVYIPGVSDLDAGMGGFSQEASAARYAASQRQRALERDIRRWKRIQAASITPGDERAAKAHVDLLQRRLRALTGEYDLPRRYDREGGRVPLTDSARAIKPFTIRKTGAIINSRGERIMPRIERPIEQRNTGKGNPNAILHFDRPLNRRQATLLDALPAYDSRTTVKKRDVNMHDLAALTAHTGDEYAMFTRKGERLIVRGDQRMTNISADEAQAMALDGWRWSGHTHPGTTLFCLYPSDGDRFILEAFGQRTSSIYNSVGQWTTFGEEE